MPTAFSSAASARAKRSASADVAAAPERRHRRPFGERRLEPRDAAALLVDADPQRQIGHQARRFAAQLGDLFRLGDVAREEDDAAEPELARERLHLCRQRMSVEPSDEQLTDLPAEHGTATQARFYRDCRATSVALALQHLERSTENRSA